MKNIKSVEKAIDILSCFTVETPSLTVTEISTLTGFNQSTVSRILATLEKKRCVERETPGGKYQLGVKFHQWKGILSKEAGLGELARPVMERLRDDCGEEVTLYVPGEGNRICVEAVRSRYGVAKVTRVGKIFPLHCGASGKVILAYLPEQERRGVIGDRPLEKYTEQTIIDPVELEADLGRIRQDGYAVSVGEREEGTFSVVAPVMGKKGRILASLCISGPIFRFSDEERSRHIQAVLGAAGEISATLATAGSHRVHRMRDGADAAAR